MEDSDSKSTSEPDLDSSSKEFIPAKKLSKRLDSTIPIYLEFRDITYEVPLPSKKKCPPCQKDWLRLLNGVNGYVEPGMLIAFMGPSGAGKTTLLDVLALRKTAGKMSGEIFINGAPMDPKLLPRYSGYVEQQNLHVPSQTVKEALDLSAALRLDYTVEARAQGKTISQLDRRQHVNWVLEVLDLYGIRHAMIQELSLEQKKRVTIGVELAANPSLLWLDEPTSGLDSMAAFRIMKAVQTITDNGVAAVCTLHQPSQQIFQMATHLMLLSKGGKQAYFGSLKEAGWQRQVEYFERLGFAFEAERNPADFFLDCCSNYQQPLKDQHTGPSATNEEDRVPVADSFQQSPEYENLIDVLDNHRLIPRREIPPKLSLPLRILYSIPCVKWIKNSSDSKKQEEQMIKISENAPAPPVYESKFASWAIIQYVFLLNRNFRYWWRVPESLTLIFIRSCLLGFLIGCIYSESDNSQTGANERASLIYFSALISTTNAMAFVPQIFSERTVFYRETSSATYSVNVYLCALISSAIPIIWISMVIFMIPIYFLTDLQKDWESAGYFFGCVSALSFIPFGFVLLLSSLVAAAEAANGLVSVVNILSSFTAGFLLAPSKIPPYWIWAYWTAYLHYGLEGLLINQFIGDSYYCPDNEGAAPIPVPSVMDPTRVQYYCPILHGEQVLENFDINQTWIIPDICILVGIFIFQALVASFVMNRVKHLNR